MRVPGARLPPATSPLTCASDGRFGLGRRGGAPGFAWRVDRCGVRRRRPSGVVDGEGNKLTQLHLRPLGGVAAGGELRVLLSRGSGWMIPASGVGRCCSSGGGCPGSLVLCWLAAPALCVFGEFGAAGPVLGLRSVGDRLPSRLRQAGATAKVWNLLFCGDYPRPMRRNPTSVPVRWGGTYVRPTKPWMAMQEEGFVLGDSSRRRATGRQMDAASQGSSGVFVFSVRFVVHRWLGLWSVSVFVCVRCACLWLCAGSLYCV